MSSSYRRILRSSSIVGGASVLNIFIGLLRTKVAAVLLGPAGLGLVGLFQSLMATAATVSALGFGTAGTREIAEANGREDAEAVATARRALFWGTLAVAFVGAAAFWALRELLASAVFGDTDLADEVGWLALGVALTVAAGSQNALLTGLRRIGDFARVSVLSAIVSTVLGVSALWLWGQEALLVFVLTAPLANFVIGHVFVARLPRMRTTAVPLARLIEQWRTLVRLGAAFMAAGLAATGGQFVVRTLVQRELGAESLGHFQAALMISMTYVGFVLSAMGQDYYPRLTAVIHNSALANRTVNEQTEVALLLSGPVLLATLGLAPWVIELLYSSRFAEAATVLRWQVLGDLLKVASWPLGFIILASGDGRTFMMTELLSTAVFVGLTWIGLPILGVEATGIAFLGMYAVYLPVVYWLARRRTGFGWGAGILRQLAALAFVAVAVFIIASWSVWIGAVTGVATAAGFSLYSLQRVGQMTNGGGPKGRAAMLSGRILGKLGA